MSPTRNALLAALLLTSVARAADAPPPQAAEKAAEQRLAMLPADSVTHHKITARGQTLSYTATAGTLKLRDDTGLPTASLFYVAYTLDGAAAATRPISFFFNGGPGAGSAYLHLGAAGPKVLDFPADEADGAHAKLIDNDSTWLPFTDMVFLDPVGTGYSLAAKPDEAPKRFWGVHQDAESLAKAAALWLTRNGRTASEKFVVGESYGGIRSVKVARALEESQSVILNGIIMVSPLLEEQYFFSDDPLTYAFSLPTLAAAALERAHKFSPGAVDGAYAYALGPYLSTIAGPPPQGDAAEAFYSRVADITGLPAWVARKQRGLIQPDSHDVRSRNGRLYSLYEMSLSIADPAPEGVDNGDSPDPLLEGYGHAYGLAFAGYAADALGFKTDLTYRLLDNEVNEKWDWREGAHHILSTSADLKKLLALNPSLQVLIAHGYFDAVCPFSATRWLVTHLPIGQDRVQLKVYPGGHMLYTRTTSRAALAADAASLVGSASVGSATGPATP
jgi:carboxypeptidase C (cathepsin A)